jgi:hypothetical protein
MLRDEVLDLVDGPHSAGAEEPHNLQLSGDERAGGKDRRLGLHHRKIAPRSRKVELSVPARTV